MKKPGLTWGALVSAAFLAAACAGNRAVKTPAAPAAPLTGPAAAPPAEAARAADLEPDVRDLATREVPELKVVRFAYDSDRLDEEARATLKDNAAFLKSRPEMRVRVAGNCDQRGTVAYNLALGQRRAASVRAYYNALGVEKSRVATISYGRERPLCAEASEPCWRRNRRAATLEVLSPAVAGRSAPR